MGGIDWQHLYAYWLIICTYSVNLRVNSQTLGILENIAPSSEEVAFKGSNLVCATYRVICSITFSQYVGIIKMK